MARITPYAQKNTYKVYFKNPNGIDGTSMCFGKLHGPRRTGKKEQYKILGVMIRLEEYNKWGLYPEVKVMEKIASLSPQLISKIEKTGLVPRKVLVDLGDVQKE